MNAMSNTILIPLREETVARLMALRHTPDEALGEIMVRLIKCSNHVTSKLAHSNFPRKSERRVSGRYRLVILGESFIVATLGEVLVRTLNVLADLDVRLLERVEKMGGRTRQHVARNRDGIYWSRPDLSAHATVQFRPGWWVGTNYSRRDINRILEDICRAAGLEYPQDVNLIES